MNAQAKKVFQQERRKKRVRRTVFGTAERPRMSVFRSHKHIYVQVIDDTAGRTLAAASSQSGELREELSGLKKRDVAKKVGVLAAKHCAAANIEKVVFDRNGYRYTGRVAALADGAREGGLKF